MDINTSKYSQPKHPSNSQAELKGNQVQPPNEAKLQSASQVIETMVLEQLVNIDISSMPKAQELLFRRVVEKLDNILEAKQGKGATQKALDAGFDFRPEAVAKSISAHASGIISRFQAEHQLEQGDAKLQDFVELIQNAIQTGFEQAKDTLTGFEVFQDDVEATFDTTLTEVQKNMNSIREALGLEPASQVDSTEQEAPIQNKDIASTSNIADKQAA